MCYSGINIEDSLIDNETSFESGLCTGAYFTFMMTEPVEYDTIKQESNVETAAKLPYDFEEID